MKTQKLKILSLLVLLVYACQENPELNIDEQNSDKLRHSTMLSRTSSSGNVPNYAPNKFIIQYHDGVPEAIKEDYRDANHVVSFKPCYSCDGEIELWELEIGEFTIDPEDKSLKTRPPGNGIKVEEIVKNIDQEFTYDLEHDINSMSIGSMNSTYTSYIVNNNTGPTIAVLDSGIDAGSGGMFSTQFLYNNPDPNIASGYDFTSNNNFNFTSNNNLTIPFDDYNLKHGTKVSFIISNTMAQMGLPFQILPIKVIDGNGGGSYFNVICGLNYALSRAHIINLSLGWYDAADVNRCLDDTDTCTSRDIFSNLIDQYKNNALVVTSAGNGSSNNDDLAHYPSSFPQDNIISVAASNEDEYALADFSNYGLTNVDVCAKGENVTFYDGNDNVHYVSGTSYAAPFVSAILAKILALHGNIEPIDAIDLLIEEEAAAYNGELPISRKCNHTSE